MTPTPQYPDAVIAFIRARLDEDEAVAKAATAGPWCVSITRYGCIDAGAYDTVIEPGSVKCGSYCYGGSSTVEMSAEDAEHIARFDPARVLAEVAAKRAIVEECADALGANQNRMEGYEMHQNDGAREIARVTLRHLAAVYSDHPDYREEWKP